MYKIYRQNLYNCTRFVLPTSRPPYGMLKASALPTDHLYLMGVINFHWNMAMRSHLGDSDLPRSRQNLAQIRRKCLKTSLTRRPTVCAPLIGLTRTQAVYISG